MFENKKKSQNIRLRSMKKNEINSVISLVKKLKLPVEHVLEYNNFFIVAEYQNKIIGCGCLTFYDNNIVEIRSIAVKKRFQKRRVGSKIIKKLFEIAKRKNIHTVYTRTSMKTKGFFLKLEFKEMPKNMILRLFDKCKSCEKYVNNKCDSILMDVNLLE